LEILIAGIYKYYTGFSEAKIKLYTFYAPFFILYCRQGMTGAMEFQLLFSPA